MLKTIASLWKSKAGSKAVLNGYMESGERDKKGAKVVMFKNDKATDENRQPQFRLCVEVDDEQPQAKPAPRTNPDDFSASDDDVPF